MSCKDMNGVINDKAVYVKQWSASKSLENLSKAIKVFGGKLSPFVTGEYMMGDIIAIINSDTKEMMPLVLEFISSARIEGEEVKVATFDKFYNGDLLFALKVFAFVCEVQYKDFFEQGRLLTGNSPD